MYDQLPNQQAIQNVVHGLTLNNIQVHVVNNAEEAKIKAQELIPEGSEVMTMTSVTLQDTGIDELLNKSGKYNPVREQLYALDRDTQKKEMNKIGGVHDYAIGSANAITEDGQIVHASLTGSQIPAYAAGAVNVIYVISTKKIVPDLHAAIKRIEDYVLPNESDRAHKAYGVPGSKINKLLITRGDFPGRVQVILVKEDFGY
jgi:L-lactate utilization protein LutC